ncbi:hypothetical protein [Legionella rowbothamii]|uniref:hypothetical protein n=1 Tax=Legionella rowbothamii TaxID=96229 RepID=UPI001054E28E|nr:hypothetical protein [Legionella rowbothamii]
MGRNTSSAFFHPDVSVSAKELIKFLKAKPQISDINEFSQKLELLREKLTHAETTDEIVSITYQMIELQKNVRAYLETKKSELAITVNADVEKKILELLELKENASIRILFTYTDMAAKNISAAAEKIALENMYASLNDEKRIEAIKFIDSLNSLQDITQQMTIKYKEFAELLKNAETMDEIDFIEGRIDSLHSSLRREFLKLVSIPKDQETQRVVFKVVNESPRLQGILMAFSPQEILAENIMDAKIELALNQTPSP